MKIARGLVIASLLLLITVSGAVATPEGQLTWGIHISLAPTWFDPAETSGIITPFMVLYALHDSLVKAMPGNGMAPSLVESWSVSPDGLVYEFVLRKAVKFHNGDLLTAEDVTFSFERYRGAAYKALKESVAAVEMPDPGRVRFRLKRAWPDFATFYLSATGASWIVPKNYVEKVGDEGFKKAPVGADLAARSSMRRSWSPTGASISLPLRTRNVSIAACPTRLLPSTNGRFRTSEKQSAAAFSSSVGYRSRPPNVAFG